MFAHLTNYLLHYRQVGIPEIGAFKMEQQHASMNMSERLIQPPAYTIQFNDSDFVSEHQLSVLAGKMNNDIKSVREQLAELGRNLNSHLQKESFLWKGLGELENVDNAIQFHPAPALASFLQPVPAERMLREHVQHTVLVGEKEVQTGEVVVEELPKRKWSPVMIIAWILVVLSIAFIGFYFYQKGLKPSSSGNQMKINVERTR